jgi:hypothetical protein
MPASHFTIGALKFFLVLALDPPNDLNPSNAKVTASAVSPRAAFSRHYRFYQLKPLLGGQQLNST